MSLIDTAKDIYDLATKGATVELQTQLMKLREEALSLQEDNLKLRARISELESQLQTKEQLQFDQSVYWRIVDGGTKEGPYCQRCYDVEARLFGCTTTSIRTTVRATIAGSAKRATSPTMTTPTRSSNNRLEFAHTARPTRKSDALLLAAQAER